MNFLKLPAGTGYILGLLGVFIGICLLFSSIYHLVLKQIYWRRHMDRRLGSKKRQRLAQGQILRHVQEMEGSVVVAIAQKLGAWGKIENLHRHLLQAGIFWHPATFLSVVGLVACTGYLISSFYLGILPSLGVALGVGYLPFLFVRFKRNRKTRLFEQQMPETMELLARSLRAGHAMPSSIELASKEIPNPMGMEMKIVYEEQRLGLGLNDALRRMGERVASQDLQYFITAVLLQTETGGNLSEIMENIGHLIRERLKLKGKVRALTAEGRYSALILSLLPFVVFVALYILNRSYVDILFIEPAGPKIIAAGITSIILGIFWMRRIIQIKV